MKKNKKKIIPMKKSCVVNLPIGIEKEKLKKKNIILTAWKRLNASY